MKLFLKEWVCLVSDEALNKLRADQNRAYAGLGSLLRHRIWREVEIVGTLDGVKLRLSNVDEEAALGGYWRGCEQPIEHKFTWDDLQDVEGVNNFLLREQVAVYQHVMGMLARLRAHALPLRRALAEV